MSCFNSQFSFGGPRPPCGKNCPDRQAKCHVTCERWLAYVEERNTNYKNRLNAGTSRRYQHG